MEGDVFTRLGPGMSGDEINADLQVAGQLLVGRFNFETDRDIYRRHPSIFKAMEVIREHRKICAEVTGPTNFREYLWGLLFNLVNLVTHIDQNTPRWNSAMLLGGNICERLERWNQIFISYSHKDRKWLERIQTQLKVLEDQGVNITLWDDSQIKSGMKWREEIEKALSASKVAILLVSTDFLASSFIQENRLSPLLKDASAGITTILPVIIEPCLFTSHPDISAYQSVNDPAKPLSMLPRPEQDAILAELADRVLGLGELTMCSLG